ncbi:MAG: ElyC/SanA/YdcF family protein [Pseudomonadota bacterium]
MWEGVRLWRGIPECKLVLTGGVIPGLNRDRSLAESIALVAAEMGVPRDAMILEDRSWNTEDQARLVGEITGKQPFALVSSAFHLPRALLMCREMGLNCVPAPADFKAKDYSLSYVTLIPSGYGLVLSQSAIKEYLAMGWFLCMHRAFGPRDNPRFGP